MTKDFYRDCSNCVNKRCGYFESPCCDCRNTEIPGTDKYESKPFLWEGNEPENVDHPSHYNQGKFECIDVMVETFGREATKNFCLLNAFKYIWRTGEKNGSEDIEKAIWYLNEHLELER